MLTLNPLKKLSSRAALALLLAASVASAGAVAQESTAQKAFGSDWQSWKADNSVADVASLQRGARDFLNYCNACHSLKYIRYSRIGEDLKIPTSLMQQLLVPPNKKPTDYIDSSMPQQEAADWFGKDPPDLSLMAEELGTDYIYQYLTTFYVDPSRPTGTNNLALATTAMPDVVSQLEGLKRAVFKTVDVDGTKEQVFDHFESIVPGSLTREQYDDFARDIVNFLDYVSEPAQVHRHSLGVWVVLFLLVFTWLAWMLKKEYWKDVH